MCEQRAAVAAAAAARDSHSPERAAGRSAGVVCPPRLSDGENEFARLAWLGKGGFAAVWSVEQTRTAQRFALKVVNKATLEESSSTRRRLVAEVEIHHSLLRHRRLVRFHRAFEDEVNVYLLLQQWGCGASLAHAVAARGRLPEHEAAAHTAALLDALAHLHARGVAHRDVKPANCLLRRQEPAATLPEGQPSCVGLADLGLATRCGTGVPARRGLCGTPNYLAPEALAPGPTARHGREADVWALGCLTHTLLVGHPPFVAANVAGTYARIKAGDMRMAPHLSPAAQDFIRTALRMDPQERPSATALLQHPFVAAYAAMPPPAAGDDDDVADDDVAAPATPQPLLAAGCSCSPARSLPAHGSPGRLAPRGSPGGACGSPRAVLRDSPARGRDARSRLGAPPPMSMAASPATPAPSPAARVPEATPRAARVVHLTPGTPYTPATPAAEVDAATPPASPGALPAGGDAAEAWPQTLRVVSYADCADRYGLGYTLSDGTVGALFLDGSRMVAAPGGPLRHTTPRKKNQRASAEAASPVAATAMLLRAAAPEEQTPALSKKTEALRFMASQMGAAFTAPDAAAAAAEAPPTAPHVVAWARSKHALAFRLSTRAVQLRFHQDGSQLLLSPDGATVWFDYGAAGATRHSLAGLPAQQGADTPLMRRLRFARTLLVRLAAAGSGADGSPGDAGQEIDSLVL